VRLPGIYVSEVGRRSVTYISYAGARVLLLFTVIVYVTVSLASAKIGETVFVSVTVGFMTLILIDDDVVLEE
jgi:hypothetical protein